MAIRDKKKTVAKSPQQSRGKSKKSENSSTISAEQFVEKLTPLRSAIELKKYVVFTPLFLQIKADLRNENHE